MTRTGVVGAGRVGAVLAAALRAAGHEIVSVAGESPASRRRIDALLPGVPVQRPAEVARSCDLLLVTVPDDAVRPVVEALAEEGAISAGQYVVHASGRLGPAALQPAADVGAHVLALHPAMTFSGTRTDLPRLRGTAFAVTATPPTEALADELATALGGRPFRVAEESRTLYHAGIVHGANHLVTLVAEATEVLGRAGVDDPAATLRPLLDAVLANTLDRGDAALTGPVVRGDVGTVRAHLADLAAHAPDVLGSYVAMARATLRRASDGGRLSAPQADALAEVLDRADARPGVPA